MKIERLSEVDVEQRRLDWVVVAAAVTAVAGGPVTVRRIVPARGEAWVREGRIAVQTHRTAAPLIRDARDGVGR